MSLNVKRTSSSAHNSMGGAPAKQTVAIASPKNILGKQ
jgi:hypothetical protein